MPPKVKVNVISEPSEDNVSYDAIVEASNVKQEESQLLDNEDGVNTSQETHADDVRVVLKKNLDLNVLLKRKLLQLKKTCLGVTQASMAYAMNNLKKTCLGVTQASMAYAMKNLKKKSLQKTCLGVIQASMAYAMK